MAVVRGDDDQCVLFVCRVHCHLHRIGQCDGVGQRTPGVAEMVTVVHASRLHHQHVASAGRLQALDRETCHLRNRWFACPVADPVHVELHVGRFEQTQYGRTVCRDLIELLLGPDVVTRGSILPLRREITSVQALAELIRILRVRSGFRQKLLAPTAEHHLDAVSVTELEELARDVFAAGLSGFVREIRVRLPVAFRRVRITCRGRGVGHAGRGDDAGGQSRRLCTFDQRGHPGARG